MKRFLLDTSVVSELRKQRPHGAVVSWMRSLQPVQMFVSAVTIGELQYGAEITRRQDKRRAGELDEWIGELADGAQVLSMDTACFREWAALMQHRSSDLILDVMLAATAKVHGLTVATRNENDFKHFRVEIWNPFRDQ